MSELPNNLRLSIDRLVDGELKDDDLRRLLLALDDAPEHWRMVALAYIEAQTWESDLRKLASAGATSATKSWPSRGKANSTMSRVASLLIAMAAGVLLTLGWSHLNKTNMSSSQNSPVAAGATDTPNNEEIPRTLPVSELDEPDPVGDAKFFVSTGGERREMHLPVYAADDLNDALLSASPLPAELVRALDETGQRWTRQRELVPVQLDDGRQVIVPIHQISFEAPVVYQ